jgi:hypothetical protein
MMRGIARVHGNRLNFEKKTNRQHPTGDRLVLLYSTERMSSL